MYLYCTCALFMLPLAVKSDGASALRCCCRVVSDEVKRNVTCRLETRALYPSLTSRTCRSVMSKLQCGSSRLVLGRGVSSSEAREAVQAGWSLTSESRTTHSPQTHNHKPDAMQHFLRVKAQSSRSVKPQGAQPCPADLDTWTLTR